MAVYKPLLADADYTSPIDVAVVHETIEHIFVADKHLAQGRRRIVGSILNWKEREQNKQLQHLKTGEFAIRILNWPDDFALYPYAVHNGWYAVYCLAGVIVCKKLLEFTDNMSIFVHG